MQVLFSLHLLRYFIQSAHGEWSQIYRNLCTVWYPVSVYMFSNFRCVEILTVINLVFSFCNFWNPCLLWQVILSDKSFRAETALAIGVVSSPKQKKKKRYIVDFPTTDRNHNSSRLDIFNHWNNPYK